MSCSRAVVVPSFWSTHREASLNWLAVGLLLAAWNASDDEVAASNPRPQALRGHAPVTVREFRRLDHI